MLSYPLGRHLGAPRQKKPKKQKQPSVAFIASVWMYCDDTGRNTEHHLISFPNETTACEAVAMIWQRTQRANLGRDPSMYRLLSAFADGAINDKSPFLHHHEPLRPQLTFPYMLACCLDPFIIKTESLQRRETRCRGDILVQHSSSYGYPTEYYDLLQALLHMWSITCKREAEQRRRIYLSSEFARHEVIELLTLKHEEEQRGGIYVAWQEGLAQLYQLADASLVEMHSRAALREEEAVCRRGVVGGWVDCLEKQAESRMAAESAAGLIGVIREEYSKCMRAKRMLYNMSRIASNVTEATHERSTPFAFNSFRVELHHDLKNTAPVHDIADPNCIHGDFYTSSWSLPSRVIPSHTLSKPSLGMLREHKEFLVRKKPHLAPGCQPSLLFLEW